MKSIYDTQELLNLHAVKEVAHWRNQKFITDEQFSAIRTQYASKLYHPNFAIRILLFIASCIAISGAGGLFLVILDGMGDAGYGVMLLIFGLAMLFFVQKVLIDGHKHFRSGVVEACAYSAILSIVGGIGLITDGNEHILFLSGIGVCCYMSYRFLDLLCHIVGMLTLGGFIFYESYVAGGIFRQVVPFIMIPSFSGIYFLARRWKKNEEFALWSDNLKLTEIICLLFVYVAGNYLVVRECSLALLGVSLTQGEDIPFAFLFYGLTAGIPLLLIYRGIKLGSITLLRLGVIILVLSVLTFRHYFSIAPPEVALTLGGLVVLGLTVWLFKLLKVNRGVFTKDKQLSKQWISPEVAAFAVSQTMGGNTVRHEDTFKGGGGSFGGGGASGDF